MNPLNKKLESRLEWTKILISTIALMTTFLSFSEVKLYIYIYCKGGDWDPKPEK